ncbi:MAG: hypothetical protein A2054_04700 [Deltaproteobacteria bacterium GWA2_55_10]|nr:MAG: hypothetical protein A2054_04700 [Deltaproteobacteria bacterium GWA2_55_10]
MAGSRLIKALLLAGILFFAHGCAAPVAPLLPIALPAVIAGAGGGISYTVTNIAYRTMTNPVEEVERGALKAARDMSLKVIKVERNALSVEIIARTRVHKITVTLERLTPTLTRMSVNAKRGFISKDKTTAFEIIYQTEMAITAFAMERGIEPGSARPRLGQGQRPGA